MAADRRSLPPGYLGWWTPFAGQPQLLDRLRTRAGETGRIRRHRHREPDPGLGTVWLRFAIDVTHDRVLRIWMITTAHFMTQSWGAFDAAAPIKSPAPGLTARG